MAFSLLWLSEVLNKAGCKTALVPGWEERGTREIGKIVGVICHHTAGSKTGNMPTLHTLIHGRSDLPGPLSQLGLGRDGTYYIIAAGRCNHAGEGNWKGFVNGNSNFIGIEAENTGRADDLPWPDVQLEAYRRGVAAILQHIGGSEQMCAGHKEFRLPKGTKNDPSFDMDAFRNAVGDILNGVAPAFSLIPAREPSNGRVTLRRGMTNELVKLVQSKLRLQEDGIFGAGTEAALRAFQRRHLLVPDGIVGPKTWLILDKELDSV